MNPRDEKPCQYHTDETSGQYVGMLTSTTMLTHAVGNLGLARVVTRSLPQNLGRQLQSKYGTNPGIHG